MPVKEKDLKKKIVEVGRKIYQRNLAVASSGNISARLSDRVILITGAQSQLTDLSFSDIVKINIDSDKKEKQAASSELPLHSLVYQNFSSKVVLHCHPPLVNGYFAVKPTLTPLTFETRFCLGDIPVIKQTTPTVTNPDEVIQALRISNIVVLRNHGVVAIGDDFSKALALIETLEDAVKSAAVAEIFKAGDKSDHKDSEKKSQKEKSSAYLMFSDKHIEKIVELVNKDDFIAQKGEELNLTVDLAIKLLSSGKAYRFIWEKGKVKEIKHDAEAPFVISASSDVWRDVFLGKIDPFVAVTQGKMDLKGPLGQLSQWYVPFSRLFEIFKEVELEEQSKK